MNSQPERIPRLNFNRILSPCHPSREELRRSVVDAGWVEPDDERWQRIFSEEPAASHVFLPHDHEEKKYSVIQRAGKPRQDRYIAATAEWVDRLWANLSRRPEEPEEPAAPAEPKEAEEDEEEDKQEANRYGYKTQMTIQDAMRVLNMTEAQVRSQLHVVWVKLEPEKKFPRVLRYAERWQIPGNFREERGVHRVVCLKCGKGAWWLWRSHESRFCLWCDTPDDIYLIHRTMPAFPIRPGTRKRPPTGQITPSEPSVDRYPPEEEEQYTEESALERNEWLDVPEPEEMSEDEVATLSLDELAMLRQGGEKWATYEVVQRLEGRDYFRELDYWLKDTAPFSPDVDPNSTAVELANPADVERVMMEDADNALLAYKSDGGRGVGPFVYERIKWGIYNLFDHYAPERLMSLEDFQQHTGLEDPFEVDILEETPQIAAWVDDITRRLNPKKAQAFRRYLALEYRTVDRKKNVAGVAKLVGVDSSTIYDWKRRLRSYPTVFFTTSEGGVEPPLERRNRDRSSKKFPEGIMDLTPYNAVQLINNSEWEPVLGSSGLPTMKIPRKTKEKIPKSEVHAWVIDDHPECQLGTGLRGDSWLPDWITERRNKEDSHD